MPRTKKQPSPATSPAASPRPRDLLLVGGGVAAVFLAWIAYLWVWSSPYSGSREAQNCGEVSQQGKAFADVRAPHALLPVEGQSLNFSWTFADVSEPYRQSTRLYWASDAAGASPPASETVPPGTFAELSLTPLTNKERTSRIPDGQVGFYAIAGPDYVEVVLCVDGRGSDPGVYTGALSFADRQVRAAPIAVTITIPTDERVPLTFFSIGALLAFVLVLVRAWGIGPVSTPALSVAFVVALAGAVTQSGPLQAASAPTWGARFTDRLGLMFATLLAVFGAAAFGEIWTEAKRARQADDDQSTTSPKGSARKGSKDGR